VKLSDEDLSRYSNKLESVGLTKCPHYYCLSKKVMSQKHTFRRAYPTSWRKNSYLVTSMSPYVYNE